MLLEWLWRPELEVRGGMALGEVSMLTVTTTARRTQEEEEEVVE